MSFIPWMRLYYRLTIVLLFFILCASAYTQSEFRLKADHAFRNKDYSEAIRLYSKVSDLDKDLQSLERRAICYFESNQLTAAIADFTFSRKLGNKNPMLFWYMGQCQQHLNNWDEAIYFYKEYIGITKETDALYIRALKEIKNCLYAIDHTSVTSYKSYIQEVGGEVNSPKDEIYPVQSPQFGNLFYYSSNKQHKHAIQATQLDETGQWLGVDQKHRMFNSDNNNVLQDIDGSGKALLYKNESGFIITCYDANNQEQKFEVEDPMFKNILDVQIVNSDTIAFVADLPNGYGGLDIYYSIYESGVWSKPKNAGAAINSAFNERSPYFSSDLKHLFFSSDRPYTFGGYDIFHYSKENAFPDNLGPIINSTAHDLHFKLDEDGQMAVFSSDRKTGKGGFDMLMAYVEHYEDWKPKDEKTFQYALDLLEKNSTRSKPININKVKKPEPEQQHIPDNIMPEISLPFSITYEDSHDLNDSTTHAQIKQLAHALKDSKNKIVIIAHTDSDEPGLEEYIQYSTLKRAIGIAEKLIAESINPDRIRIESYGKNYPAIKESPLIGDSISALNKRIDIIEDTGSGESGYLNYLTSLTERKFLNNQLEIFGLLREGLYYSVKIASSQRMYKNAILRLYNDVYIRKENPDSDNNYYVGLYSNFDSATDLLQNLQSNGLPTAELQAFLNGRLLSKAEIQSLTNTYPELRAINR